MITIDGAVGGGQVLRTALALSALNAQPVRITDIRGARDTPGLRPQHLAAVRMMKRLTDAEVDGVDEGAQEISFAPRHRPRGDIEIDIGTAGSITLLFDTVVCLGPVLDDPISVTATGGTDVKWSPTMDYFRLVKLPCLRYHGHEVDVQVDRHGYYPTGGGRATLRVAPGESTAIQLRARGPVDGVRLSSRATTDLEERAVANRQAEAAADALGETGRRVTEIQTEYVDANSTGSSLLAVASIEGGFIGADTLGERGRSAESVGQRVANELEEYLASDAPVDPHLADQLMLPLALAGGDIQIPAVTEHIRSNASVLEAYGFDLRVEEADAISLSAPPR